MGCKQKCSILSPYQTSKSCNLHLALCSFPVFQLEKHFKGLLRDFVGKIACPQCPSQFSFPANGLKPVMCSFELDLRESARFYTQTWNELGSISNFVAPFKDESLVCSMGAISHAPSSFLIPVSGMHQFPQLSHWTGD